MDDSEKELIRQSLNDALEVIDGVIPEFGALIRNFTRRIIIRKSGDERRGDHLRYGSEHVPRQPGSIRIHNAHSKHLTKAHFIETLLHESIHNFLAAWETGHQRFFDEGNQYRPMSPWSGNPIPNSSLSHAIFIYFACHRLFSHLLDIDDVFDAKARRHAYSRRNVFAAGFMIDQPLSTLFMSEQGPRENLATSLDHMQRLIKGIYKQSLGFEVAA